jgi:1-acyl-sn-glycerol-3-phosphate acyltransferase
MVTEAQTITSPFPGAGARPAPLPGYVADVIAGSARLAFGVAVCWSGWIPDARPRVYFANHTSHLDSLVLWSALPPEVRTRARPVAARDYWGQGRPARGRLAALLGVVLVERHNPTPEACAAQVTVLLEALEARASLIVFPEGTRGAGPEVGAFKSGLYHLGHRRPGLDLVPVHLHNLGRILPKGALLPVPMLSRVTFGRPLQVGERESKEGFLARARAAVASLGPA